MVTGRYDWNAPSAIADGNEIEVLEVAHIVPYAWNGPKNTEVRPNNYIFTSSIYVR